MTNLIIEMPDDLARSLEGIAAAQHKSVQQLAVEQPRSLVEASPEPRPGSPDALLRAMREPPHLSPADVEDLEAAIAAAIPNSSRLGYRTVPVIGPDSTFRKIPGGKTFPDKDI